MFHVGLGDENDRKQTLPGRGWFRPGAGPQPSTPMSTFTSRRLPPAGSTRSKSGLVFFHAKHCAGSAVEPQPNRVKPSKLSSRHTVSTLNLSSGESVK